MRLQEEELAKLGLDASKAHRLETAETAEALYKKREKKPAPEGWWVACLHACILAVGCGRAAGLLATQDWWAGWRVPRLLQPQGTYWLVVKSLAERVRAPLPWCPVLRGLPGSSSTRPRLRLPTRSGQTRSSQTGPSMRRPRWVVRVCAGVCVLSNVREGGGCAVRGRSQTLQATSLWLEDLAGCCLPRRGMWRDLLGSNRKLLRPVLPQRC